jgi:ribonuclease BN (tRNA processing enzyme)
LLADTKYFPQLERFYSTQVLIICVVFHQPHAGVEHLSLDDARQIISRAKPGTAILTHFGMTMLKSRPRLIAQRLSQELDTDVIAAYDGMTLPF